MPKTYRLSNPAAMVWRTSSRKIDSISSPFSSQGISQLASAAWWYLLVICISFTNARECIDKGAPMSIGSRPNV